MNLLTEKSHGSGRWSLKEDEDSDFDIVNVKNLKK